MRRHLLLLLLAAPLILTAEPPSAQKPNQPVAAKKQPATAVRGGNAQPAAPTAKQPPKLLTIKPKPFQVTIELQGTLAPEHAAPLSLRPKTWTEFVIDTVVDHGVRVKPGDPVIVFESKTMDRQIDDLETKIAVDALNIAKAKHQSAYMKTAFELQKKAAARDFKIAQQDLERFRKIFRPAQERQAQFSVKDIRNMLDYEEAELKQLKEMYEEDEVSEETEEIILRRQEDWIDKLTFYLKEQTITSEQQLKVELPRREQLLADDLARTKVELDRLKLELPAMIQTQELQIQQQELQLAHAKTQLADLEADTALMTIRATDAAMVYYGTFERGKWQVGAAAANLKPGGRIQPHVGFITLVSLAPVYLSAELQEGDRKHLAPGTAARLTAAFAPQVPFQGTLQSISRVPVRPGTFHCRIRPLIPKKLQPSLMPGMACTAHFNVYTKKDAITVPATSVFTDELDADKRYVWLWNEATETATRQLVNVGLSSDGQTEILGSLKAGDKILTSPPQDDIQSLP